MFVIETRNAVLMDNVEVVLVEDMIPDRKMVGLWLAGRINRSSDRAEVLYLFDVDGAAAIVAELMGLVRRAGPDLEAALDRRLQELANAGLFEHRGGTDA